MAGMRHPNVLPLLAAFIEGGLLWMVLPFYAAGSPAVHHPVPPPRGDFTRPRPQNRTLSGDTIRPFRNVKPSSPQYFRAPHRKHVARAPSMTTCRGGLCGCLCGKRQGQRQSSFAFAEQGVNDWHAVATVMREVARGLAYMHQSGRIHRDLKAANILVAPDGRVCLAGAFS